MRLLRAVTLACGIALAGASAAAPVATAPDDPAADRVIAAIATRAAPIKAYTFNLNVRVALLTFPWIRFTLVGHGEYERNGSFLIHFDHVPWFGKGYSTIKMDALDPSNWSKHYVITLAGQDGTVSHLSMRDRIKSPLQEATATIDEASGVRDLSWLWDYGGRIVVHVTPIFVSGYPFPQFEDADISMPQYHATAHAEFSDYNVTVDPSPTPPTVVK